jgi:hypothetical protein
MKQLGIISPAAVIRQEERGFLPQWLCPHPYNLYALLNFLNNHVTVAAGRGRINLNLDARLKPYYDVCKASGDTCRAGTDFDDVQGRVPHRAGSCKPQVTHILQGASSSLYDSGVVVTISAPN